MGRVSGKVAFVTGAARGQGRAHALRLAEEGADIIGIDSVAPIETVSYDMPTVADLESLQAEVEAMDRRVVTAAVDVRDANAMGTIVSDGADALGGLDVIVANAGIVGPVRKAWEYSDAEWQAVIDVNLTGVWQTVRASVPGMIERRTKGSIIFIASVGGLMGAPNVSNYIAAKHGVIGLARSLANELGEHEIRVNAICPTNVRTPMLDNDATARLFRPDLVDPSLDESVDIMKSLNILPVPWVGVEDIANAALWLASDESRYVTGVALPVDAGLTAKYG